MMDAARRACEIAAGKVVERLEPESESALALARLLEIIGEAATHVSAETRSKVPDVPWRDLSDTRNRIIHRYFDVDLEIVGAIVRDDLPALLESLEAISVEPTRRR